MWHVGINGLQLQTDATGYNTLMHNAPQRMATFEQRVGGLKRSLTTDTQVTLKSVKHRVFSTANTERLRIDSSGNVGIGESTQSTAT